MHVDSSGCHHVIMHVICYQFESDWSQEGPLRTVTIVNNPDAYVNRTFAEAGKMA